MLSLKTIVLSNSKASFATASLKKKTKKTNKKTVDLSTSKYYQSIFSRINSVVLTGKFFHKTTPSSLTYSPKAILNKHREKT
jgi:hypothetical protein